MLSGPLKFQIIIQGAFLRLPLNFLKPHLRNKTSYHSTSILLIMRTFLSSLFAVVPLETVVGTKNSKEKKVKHKVHIGQ